MKSPCQKSKSKSLTQQIEEYNFSRPPLPSDYHFLPMSNSKTPSEKSDTLQRLEVETTSTTSVPISFPYYYIDDKNSLDTFNLLANASGESVKNTGEFKTLNPNGSPNETTGTGAGTGASGTVSGPGTSPGTGSSPDSNSKIKQSISNDVFNQVPQRFSQFIVDQQKFNQSRPEELALNTNTNDSFDTDSDRPLAWSQKKSRNSGSSRRRQSASRKKSSNSVYDHHRASATRPTGTGSQGLGSRSNARPNVSRQISNSMESQATIFSTRPDETSESRNLNSTTSSLRRSRAIKSKQGSVFYRMKLRLKKWLANLKRLKFSRIVPSKRTKSIRRNNTRSRTLKRKYRANPQNPTVQKIMNISAPTNNPHLGQMAAKKVATLDHTLKYQAGAPADNVNHLSDFIDQQQGLYLNDMEKKSGSINYHKNERNSPKDSYQSDIEEVPLSECSSIPPPPPKHQYQEGQEVTDRQAGDYSQMMELWRQYLAHVISKRIQLRQEISLFQQMVVGQDMKARKLSFGSAYDMYDIREDPNAEDYGYLDGYETENQDDDDETGTITSKYSNSTSGYETITDSNATSNVTTTNSTNSNMSSTDNDMVQYFPDPDDKFNKKYNRQSMLSEMLDYESEDSDLTISDDSVQRHHSVHTLDLGKQYSVKHKNGTRSFSSASQMSQMSPLRRSDGYHDLNQI